MQWKTVLPLKHKFLTAYFRTADAFARLSSAKKLQVGCIIVKDDRIISIGYNGTPSGANNVCETITSVELDGTPVYKTKPEVLHAETNAISKLARSSESGLDAYMICTHAPCLECAKLIYQTGIAYVYYREEYRSREGIELLEQLGVKVIKYNNSYG